MIKEKNKKERLTIKERIMKKGIIKINKKTIRKRAMKKE